MEQKKLSTSSKSSSLSNQQSIQEIELPFLDNILSMLSITKKFEELFLEKFKNQDAVSKHVLGYIKKNNLNTDNTDNINRKIAGIAKKINDGVDDKIKLKAYISELVLLEKIRDNNFDLSKVDNNFKEVFLKTQFNLFAQKIAGDWADVRTEMKLANGKKTYKNIEQINEEKSRVLDKNLSEFFSDFDFSNGEKGDLFNVLEDLKDTSKTIDEQFKGNVGVGNIVSAVIKARPLSLISDVFKLQKLYSNTKINDLNDGKSFDSDEADEEEKKATSEVNGLTLEQSKIKITEIAFEYVKIFKKLIVDLHNKTAKETQIAKTTKYKNGKEIKGKKDGYFKLEEKDLFSYIMDGKNDKTAVGNDVYPGLQSFVGDLKLYDIEGLPVNPILNLIQNIIKYEVLIQSKSNNNNDKKLELIDKILEGIKIIGKYVINNVVFREQNKEGQQVTIQSNNQSIYKALYPEAQDDLCNILNKYSKSSDQNHSDIDTANREIARLINENNALKAKLEEYQSKQLPSANMNLSSQNLAAGQNPTNVIDPKSMKTNKGQGVCGGEVSSGTKK